MSEDLTGGTVRVQGLDGRLYQVPLDTVEKWGNGDLDIDSSPEWRQILPVICREWRRDYLNKRFLKALNNNTGGNHVGSSADSTTSA